MGLKALAGRLAVGIAAAVGISSSTLAQVVGPDVIVGDLPAMDHYTGGGPINGYHAYAVATTSCNVGDDILEWISNTNRHPVISQNMYRLKDGRFTQVGQAWLKHAFCALQQSFCGTCNPNPSGCPALGVGCSDPYSASLNGSQSGLGPKSEVNAATGFFPYPWINNGTGEATLKKRLLVPASEIDASSLYFVSSIYISPDDAEFGNDDNNQSYRRVVLNASNGSPSLVDTTQRTKPAIFAWRDHGAGANTPDPDVILTPVDVPNDGRFWIAGKATDRGGGVWHYEYAVQNLNSDRSGQSLSFPLPPGAVVTNAGFSDIGYHSGEPYSGTDWTITNTGSELRFAGNTFAQGINSNALRWDTIYNFWFDCNVPPAALNVTLGLFKPGTPTSVQASIVGPSPDGLFHPYNDSCSNAAQIGDGSYPFSNLNAVTDGPDEPNACVVSGYTNIDADVWFRYRAACAGTVTISTCGSTFDTKIAVYAACPTGPGQSIACNDDGGGCGLGSTTSFTAVSGQEVLIRVGGFRGEVGSGTLVVTGPNCGPTPPANDLCANAQWVSDGASISGNNSLAGTDGSAGCANSTKDVWYKYRPARNGTVTVDTNGSGSHDTVISVYTGACGSLTQIACDDDSGTGLNSQASFTGVANTVYLVRVATFGSSSAGNFTFHLNGGGGIAPPVNDDCGNRPGISLGANTFTTLGATTDGPAHAACLSSGSNQISNDVWFNYPSQCNGRLVLSTCGSADFNTRIAVYSGSGCTNFESRLIGCIDDAAQCPGGTTELIIPVVSGQNYTIRLGGYLGSTGTGTLTLTCLPPCPADFNGDGFVDFFDLDDFVAAFEAGDADADFNNDGFVDFFDFDDYVASFEAGC